MLCNISVSPAVQFNPVVAGITFDKKAKRLKMSDRQPRTRPADLEATGFHLRLPTL